MSTPKKVRIGDILVENGEITEQQLKLALEEQKQSGRKLGAVLVAKGFIDENRFLMFLSQQFGIPFVDLRERDVDPAIARRMDETQARRYRAVLLGIEDGRAVVGMADPMDIFAIDDISRILQVRVQPAVVRESELLAALDIVYRRTDDIVTFAEALKVELDIDDEPESELDDDGAGSPVVRLLDSIMRDAVQMRASDVHIEPGADVLRIRQRIDGMLHEQVLREVNIAPALVSRLKLNAGLNISERRLPQDGRFNAAVNGKSIDIRLSTMPVRHGESVVMRLLNRSEQIADLSSSGMPPRMLDLFRRAIASPHGLVLVTGPTGSGKTTTLYSALSELNQPGRKIITIEDPVEYELERINQVQVNPTIGLSFASVLRASLRQDPDVVLVGEIRDSDTAEIALRAAMTGHLVLSTLHTNDALSAPLRLLDMGVDTFLVAAALRGVVAQRLVRRLCDHCAKPLEDPDERFVIHRWLQACGIETAGRVLLRRPVGCSRCNRTGFRGRRGVFEFLRLDTELVEQLRAQEVSAFERTARAQEGYAPLLHSALALVAVGETTLGEAVQLAVGGDEPHLPAVAPGLTLNEPGTALASVVESLN